MEIKEQAKVLLGNEWYQIELCPDDGVLRVWNKATGQLLFDNGNCEIVCSGMTLNSNICGFDSSVPTSHDNLLGDGFSVYCFPLVRTIDFPLHAILVLYLGLTTPAFMIRLQVENASPQPQRLDGITVIRFDTDLGSEQDLKYLDTWDGGNGWLDLKTLSCGEYTSRESLVLLEESVADNKVTVGKDVVCGIASANKFIGHLSVHLDHPNQTVLRVEMETDGIVLESGETVYSEYVYFDAHTPFIQNYRDYYAQVSLLMRQRPLKPIPIGWCSWYYYYNHVTQEDVRANLSVLASEYKNCGLSVVQIDLGWQKDSFFGDWTSCPNRFPSGIEKISEEICQQGLIPGLWVSPFMVEVSTPVAREHPEYMLHVDGSQKIHLYPVYGGQGTRQCYMLDLSRDDVHEYLFKVFKEIGKYFRYIKLDFMSPSYIPNEFGETPKYGNLTRLEAYRRGLQTIRRALGEDAYILGCGTSLLFSAGIVDGLRVTPDISWQSKEIGDFIDHHPGYWNIIRNCSRTTLLRGAINRMIANSDPDVVIVREKLSNALLQNMDSDNIALSLEEARLMTTMVGLSGAAVLLSDNMTELSPERIEMMKKIMPVLTPSAEPVEYSPVSEIDAKWRVTLAPESKRHLLGLFNWGEEPKRFIVTADDLDGKAAPCLAWEFWTGQFVGRLDKQLTIDSVPAHAVRLLSFCADLGHPQFLSSDRHISQGAYSLHEEMWDEEECRLTVNLQDDTVLGNVVVAIYTGYDYNLLRVNLDPEDYQVDGPIVRILNRGLTDFTVQAEFTRIG